MLGEAIGTAASSKCCSVPESGASSPTKTVLDFGCGNGGDTVEIAQHGAKRVIGLDIRESVLENGRRTAREAGVADRCVFATEAPQQVDVVVSVDGFEHYADPAGAPAVHEGCCSGREAEVLVAFGPRGSIRWAVTSSRSSRGHT